MSLAVGAWLRGISTEYMRIEIMSLDHATADATTNTITAHVRNSGKDSIYLDEAYIGVVQVDLGGLELKVDLVTTVPITSLTLALEGGKTYEVKIVSTRGTQLEFSVRTP